MGFLGLGKKPPQQGGGIETAAPTSVEQPAPVQEEPKVQSEVQQIVKDNPAVVPELDAVLKQVEEKALRTMDLLEAARKDQGPFCVTIGTGKDRIVILVAPIAGREAKTVSPYDPEDRNVSTMTDFVAFTRHGTRRISFCEKREGGKNPKNNQDTAEAAKKSRAAFEAVIKRAAAGDGMIPGGYYQESTDSQGNIERNLKIPGEGTNKPEYMQAISREFFRKAGYDEVDRLGRVDDQSTVNAATRASFESTQSSRKRKLEEVREGLRQEVSAVSPGKPEVKKPSPIAPELEADVKQVEEKALRTMDLLEAARKDQGPFCVTIGTGKDRIVILVAPIAGREAKTVSPYDPEDRNVSTMTDFVAFTRHGTRRISFCEKREGGKNPKNNQDTAEAAKKSRAAFEAAIKRAAAGNGTIPGGYYQESTDSQGNIERNLKIPGEGTNKPEYMQSTSREFFRKAGYDEVDRLGRVDDQSTVNAATRANFESTQKSINQKIRDARQDLLNLDATIQAFQA